ncbi:MAG: ABC transporter permease [Cyclobacteriaceae bacterium]
MLRSFLTITFRVLWRNKVTSFVNISSLIIGITSFIFIMLYVHHELSYDKFNEKYDRIYRLEGDDYGRLPPIIGTYVKDRVPEVENIARLSVADLTYISHTPEDNPENQKHIEAISFWADSTIFNVFTLPFTQGDPHTALKEPFTVVLTENTAKKLFSGNSPIGKSIEYADHQFRITGIIKDVENFHIEMDALLSLESLPKVYPNHDPNNTAMGTWLWSATYLSMTDAVNKDFIESKINRVLAEINNGDLFDFQFKRFHVQPLKEIYFGGSTQNLPYGLHGSEKMTQAFFAIGIFMLVLACINYINLTTARSAIRAKEIAIKKVAGSSTFLLGYQLILESVIISFIAFTMAVTVLQLFLPKFNQMVMVDIRIADFNNPAVWAGAISCVVLLGIIAGVYPAFYLTAAEPIGLIKGSAKGSGGSVLRKVLMTIQFAISIVMIIGIIANVHQMEYLRNVDMGFNKEQIITASTRSNSPEQFSQRETFKGRLLQHADIMGVSFSTNHPGGHISTAILEFDGIKRSMGIFNIDQDYLDVMGMTVSEGRNFSTGGLADGSHDGTSNSRPAILLNEKAVQEFGINSPIGRVVKYQHQDGEEFQFEIIGIVRDFNFRSLHHNVEPLGMAFIPNRHRVNIKVSSANIPATLKVIEKEWKNVYGSKPFAYRFLDDVYDRHYKSDENLATVIGYFTALAVMIACLGLFALSSFMVSRRTKEIGVRKSLGASVKEIYFMLSWDFLKWIFLAVVIASPVALYLIDLWLHGFAYHFKVGADIFIIAALLAIGIALATVTWQSLKAAYANPVKALRYE